MPRCFSLPQWPPPPYQHARPKSGELANASLKLKHAPHIACRRLQPALPTPRKPSTPPTTTPPHRFVLPLTSPSIASHFNPRIHFRTMSASSNENSVPVRSTAKSEHEIANPVLQIVHFNDVYNIDTTVREPVGGAARFVTAIRDAKKAAEPLESLVIFSGDAFSPAPLTGLTAGKEIPPILNAVGVDVACVGNHDLDGGISVMRDRIGETNFPWLLSNIKMPGGAPVGGVVDEVWVGERAGIKIGMMGLAGGDWSQCLQGGASMVEWEDYVHCATRLGKQLRERGCHFIIALTHMRQPDDDRLAREVDCIDLVLGGHDHVVRTARVGGKWVVKSGTDFKNFSTMQVGVEDKWGIVTTAPVHHDVTSEVKEDPEIAAFVEQQLEALGEDYKKVLAVTDVHLDARFLSIRTQETEVGNFVADVIAEAMGAKIALINGGSFRSDTVEIPGKVTQQMLGCLLPFEDYVVLAEYTGRHIRRVIEHGLGHYPLLLGRFLQVSGIKLKFDPRNPAGERLVPDSLQLIDENGVYEPVQEDKVYRLAVKSFVHDGNDGFPEGDESSVVKTSTCSIAELVKRHFEKLAKVQQQGDEEEVVAPSIAPRKEGRIVCLHPSKKLQKAYEF